MDQKSRPTIRTGSGADVAFAVVVMVSFFAIASNTKVASIVDLLLLVASGTAYITIGIYGYAICSHSESKLLQIAYFFVQIPLGATIIYLGKGTIYSAMILLPLVAHSVLLLPTRWAYGINSAIFLAYGISTWLQKGATNIGDGIMIFLAGQVFILFFTQMAVNEERARLEVEKLVKELEKVNMQLREYSVQVEELAITKERNRLAREIHDGVGHALTAIFMQIQAARSILKSSPEKAMKTLEAAQNLSQDAIVDIRQSVSTLRASPDEILPLNTKIRKLLESCDLAGIHPDFYEIGQPRPLSPQIDLTLYRSAQEGVNNACKHSRAAHLWLSLDYSDNQLIGLQIRDDGIGSNSNGGGYGLMGIRERVQLLNGEMTISSEKGLGFCLEIKVPG